MEILIIIAIPIISSLIGWLTNVIAIKSLFKPIKQIRFLGLRVQGVFPKKQKKIAKTIALVVEEYFFSHNDITQIFKEKKNLTALKDEIGPIIFEKIIQKVPSMFKPMASPFIKEFIDTQLEGILVEFGEKIIQQIEEKVNIKKLVEEKILAYDVSNLEEIMYKIAKDEFKHIEILGAIVGFIVGLFQVVLFLLI